MYTGCPASSALLEITSRCVSTLIASCPDLCVNELLNTAVRHAPAFDWVVAHVGSCFPKTIIARVLSVGLKDFCVFHVALAKDGADNDAAAAKLLSAKMNSVVGILNYLTSRGHKSDIRFAIHSLFQDSLSPLEDDAVGDPSSSSSLDPATLQYATLPYLLHLASLSPILLKVVVADLVTSFGKPAVLRQLTEHLERWTNETSNAAKGGVSAGGERLLTLAVSLIVLVDDADGAIDVLKLLMMTADPESFASEDDDEDDIPFIPDVAKDGAMAILDHVTLQLQHRVYVSFKDKADVPFLIALKERWRPVCKLLLSASRCQDFIEEPGSTSGVASSRRRLSSRLETIVVRLLTFISLQSESLSAAVLSTLILESTSARDAALFFPILGGVQNVTPAILSNVLLAVLEAVFSRQEEPVAFRALTNLRHALDVEKRGASSSVAELTGLMPNASIKACLQRADALTWIAKILAFFSSCRVLRVGIQLLLHLGLAKSSMSSSTLLATAVAVNFFKLVAEATKNTSLSSSPTAAAFNEKELDQRLDYRRTLDLSAQFLARLCQRSPSIRTVVLRAMLEGCLSREYSSLFSSRTEAQVCCSSPSRKGWLHAVCAQQERNSPYYFFQTAMSISDSSQIGGHTLTISESVAPTACLRDDNYALPSQRSGRTLPSGVIGEGLRQKSTYPESPGSSHPQRLRGIDDSLRQTNKALLLDIFYRCCSNQEVEDLSEASVEVTAAKSSSSKKLPRLLAGKSATQSLSQLLVELVSPEVLHGGCVGGAWPEEDTIRHTVERDLLIKKRLQNNDVIVDVLDLVAKGGAASIIPSLPILRAWMASLILFWDSNRDSNPGASSSTW